MGRNLKTSNMESQYKIFESNLWPLKSLLLFPSVRKQMLNVQHYIKLQPLHCSKIMYTDNNAMFYTDTNNADYSNAFLQNTAGW